jgi:hypothetical protein
MHESYSELVLPFGSSQKVKEEYINATGGIRIGKYVVSFWPPHIYASKPSPQVDGAS